MPRLAHHDLERGVGVRRAALHDARAFDVVSHAVALRKRETDEIVGPAPVDMAARQRDARPAVDLGHADDLGRLGVGLVRVFAESYEAVRDTRLVLEAREGALRPSPGRECRQHGATDDHDQQHRDE